MTVAENVAFPLRRLRLGRPELGQRTKAMLEKVGLGAFADRYPHELSGGQQQRVALARALVARPRVLLFDEPLSALDANLRERLRLEIATLVREHGATAIYITHDQSEAFALGDEIAVLQDGEIVQRGAPEAIYGTPATPFVARFTGLSGTLEGRLLDAPVSVPGTVRVLLPTTGTRPIELAATALVPLPAGAAVQVLLRPTAPRICRPGTAAARLRAVVVERAYHGRGYDYVLALGEGLTLAGVFDRRPLQRGAAVAVYVDPAGALVFAADAARPVPPLAAPDAAPGAPPDVAGSWLMPTAEDRR
jgi:ABC-type Fe3+/spermidine/putrescine transport system ATPase subunit